MKKRMLIILLFVSLFLITNVTSQVDIPGSVPGSELLNKLDIDESGQPRKIVEAKEEFDQVRTQNDSYLLKFYINKLKSNKFIASVIEAYEKIRPFLNPIFKYTIGVDLSISFLFLFSLIIWVIFLIYLQEIFSIFSVSSESTAWVLALALSVILGAVLKIPKALAESIVNAVSLLTVH